LELNTSRGISTILQRFSKGEMAMRSSAHLGAAYRTRDTTMHRTAIVAALCLGLGAFTTAHAQASRAVGGGCPEWSCTTNGTQLTGIQAPNLDRIPPGSGEVAASAKQAAVNARSRGGCEDWGCGSTNGTRRTGLALPTGIGESITANETAVVARRQPPASQGKRSGGGGCPDWACSTNGTQLSGIALEGVECFPHRVLLNPNEAGAEGFNSRNSCDEHESRATKSLSASGPYLNGTQLTGLALSTLMADGRDTAGVKSTETEVLSMRCASKWVAGCPR
jgi:hypothetical protein